MKSIFTTYILPHITYGLSLWSPQYQKDIVLIESIQRRFTRMIVGMKDLSYEDRLAALDLPTLQERARRHDLVQTYRILNNIDNVESLFKKVKASHNKCTRNAAKENVIHNKCNFDVRKHFITQRVTQDWNSLPQEVQQARNLKLFKANLEALTLKSP